MLGSFSKLAKPEARFREGHPHAPPADSQNRNFDPPVPSTLGGALGLELPVELGGRAWARWISTRF